MEADVREAVAAPTNRVAKLTIVATMAKLRVGETASRSARPSGAKSSSSGGTLTIKAEVAPALSGVEGAKLRLSVADTGSGMDPEALRRIRGLLDRPPQP